MTKKAKQYGVICPSPLKGTLRNFFINLPLGLLVLDHPKYHQPKFDF